jgi:thiamine biosynthesis lipoprotein
MGTVVTIDVYSEQTTGSPEISMGLARARATLRQADAVFSTWKMDSPMSRLRRGEISCAEAPPEVREVLELCATARELSGGWFDPWAMPGGVDPTGYVKGWAAQRALDALVSGGVSGAMVNAAGDVASFGRPHPASAFRIGIVDPFAPRQLSCVVELSGAIATSGSYERGEHLIDPWTRRPATGAASASVTGPDLGLADALATALVVAGKSGLTSIDAVDGYEGFVISCDGEWQWTDGFGFASSDACSGRPQSSV